jgi:hypothetical protein
MRDPQPARLPDAFRAPRALRWLNVLAVGFSLAAAAGVIFALIFEGGSGGSRSFAVSCGASTLVFGLVWARIVRVRVGWFPIGWVAAIPLAAMNAGTALTAVFLAEDHGSSSALQQATIGFLLGASVGVIAWGPALLVTLLLFGLPIYLAQRAADRGLGSEDRGERVVAVVAAVISACALLASLVVARSWPEHACLGAMGTVGLVCGAVAASYASRREVDRRRFLASVQSGAVEGFRIDANAALLVRVGNGEDRDYRAPWIAEPVVELDGVGEAKRTLLEAGNS